MTGRAVPRRRPLVRRVALVVGLSAVWSAPGCTEATDEFCASLSERAGLEGLTEAVATRNEPAIRRSLADLRELEQTAPGDLLPDVRLVLDAMSEAVRAVTDTGEEDAGVAPVDLTALNDRLAAAEPAAQRIVAFADRNCGIDL